jgi:Ca2+-dependent lipid-binding protein
MDRNLQGEAFTDSYVDIWIGKHENHRTHTIRKTLNPVWDEEFRFEIVDDSLLQNTPVEFKVSFQ